MDREAHRTTTDVEARLSQLAAQFEVLKAQVRQAQQLGALGTAAAMIGHEVNNLLTPVLSYSEYALQTDDVALMKKALAVTAKNTRVLVRMSERVLEIGSASAPKREYVSVRSAIDDAIESLCRDLDKDGIDVAIDVDEGLSVFADHLQLQQVLFNLLLNAREAMVSAGGGRLTIAAVESGTNAVISIHNTGPAIPANVLPHIFDPLNSTKPADRGGKKRCGGLGLALSKDLVTENGGTISVASSDVEGTRFAITLPLAEESHESSH